MGGKDLDTQQSIDGDTRFIIASNTKSMTTLLLAKLVEKGRIDWDDPVISVCMYGFTAQRFSMGI